MSTQGRQINNVVGQRFLRLTVLKLVGHSSWLKQRRVLWLCRCDCGKLKTMVAGDLGRTHSCGCIRKEQNIIHGIKGLGNAIVPQVAEQLLRWMKEAA